MHPGGGVQHVVVVRPVLGEPAGQPIKPRLMVEFVGRLRVNADRIFDGLAITGLMHGVSLPVA
jgi:hypothetical protein